MYQWLDALPEGKIKLSLEADRYYDKIYEEIGEQAINTPMPAIRAWMFKLPSQLLRIALGLHLIECYHDANRPIWTLQKDTLERAVLFAQYYRSQFQTVQTTAADTDDISAILLQIWDKALTRHPEGISTRDAYREIKAIQYRAKDAGRPVSAYTADLFSKLEQMGKGTVSKIGRQIKFVATLTPPPITPDLDEVKTETTPPGDRVTLAETIVKPMVLTVTKDALSLVTDSRIEVSNADTTAPATSTDQEMICAGSEPLADVDQVINITPNASPLAEKTSSEAADSTPIEEANAQTEQLNLLDGTPAPSLSATPALPSVHETTGVEQIDVGDRAPESGQAPEPDFDAFPHSNPHAVWGVKKTKALEIEREILAIDGVFDFFALKDNPQYSQNELNWVRKNLLSQEQRHRLNTIVEASKKNLLSQQQRQNQKAIVEATKKDE
jgi:hypothetical protein